MSKNCPVCGKGKLEQKTKLQTIKYKKKNFKYQQPGQYCNFCKEAILSNSDMDVVEPQLFDFRASVDGYLTTTEMRRIRKKLGLTQHQASQIFGGGHNAFSRYEKGKSRPSKSTDNLLRLLDKYPELLAELPRDIAA